MTSGARYHLVTTWCVSSLLILLLPNFCVLLDMSLGLALRAPGLLEIYSVFCLCKLPWLLLFVASAVTVESLTSLRAGSSILKPTLSMPFFFRFLSPLDFVLRSEDYFPIPIGRGFKTLLLTRLISVGSACSTVVRAGSIVSTDFIVWSPVSVFAGA